MKFNSVRFRTQAFLIFGMGLVVCIGSQGCSSDADKAFKKETAHNQDKLKVCFDQGDKYGDLYHTMQGSTAGLEAFSQGRSLAGLSREEFRNSICESGDEVKGQGAKCQRACEYGFRFPHSYKGAGITLDDLWKEEDFKLPDAQ